MPLVWDTPGRCSNGGCVEMAWAPPSTSDTASCVETSECPKEGHWHLRDGKLGDASPVLTFDVKEMNAFAAAAAKGDYTR